MHCKKQQRAFSTTQVYVLLDLCFVIHYSLGCIIIRLLYSFLSLGLLFVCNPRGRVFLWSCLNCWLPDDDDDDEMITGTLDGILHITYLRPQHALIFSNHLWSREFWVIFQREVLSGWSEVSAGLWCPLVFFLLNFLWTG